MAKKELSPDRIQLEVVIDGSPARKELAELTQATTKLKQEQKDLIQQQKTLSEQRRIASMEGRTEDVKRLIKDEGALRLERRKQIDTMAQLISKQRELRGSMSSSELSLSELRKRAQDLRAQFAAGLAPPDVLLSLGKELNEVESRIKTLSTAQGRSLMIWEEERLLIDLQRMSLEQLALEEERYQRLKNKAQGDSAEYKQIEQALNKVKKRQEELTNSKQRSMQVWEEERKGIALTDMTLEQLGMEYQRAEAIREQAKPGSEYEEAAAWLTMVKDRQEQLTNSKRRAMEVWEEERKAIALTDMTLEQLEMEYARAEKILQQARPGEEYAQAAHDLEVVRDRQEQLTNTNRQAIEVWLGMRESMRIEDMSLEQLKLEKKVLEDLISTLPRTSAEFERLSTKLNQVEKELKDSTSASVKYEQEWVKMRGNIKLVDMSMEELRREIAFLEREKAKVSPTKDAEAYRLWSRSLNDAKAKMKALESGMGPFGRMWAEIRGNVVSAGAVLGGMFAGNMLMTGAQNMIRSSMQLSDAISDVKKTTGLSTPVVRELAKEIGTIDTRTSRAELLALARDAGKLGLNAKEDVLAFVRAGNQINVALGEDLGKDAIKNIGKLVDLFKLKEKYGLEDSILKVGSALNELGMASTAGEGYMVDFLKRMGGIAPIAGITIQQTLALAATLDSLGQTSEVSSTALSKLFVKLGSDAAKYADLAGVSVDRFRKVLEKNALEAFIMVLDGTKKTQGGVVALAETLGDMGIDAARAAGIFGVLGQNTDRLREQMVLANDAFRTGTSVTDEYNEKNNNLAAVYEKLMKQFNRLIANNTVISWLTDLIGTTKKVIDWIERNATAITMLAKAIGGATATWAVFRLGAAIWLKLGAAGAAITKTYAMAKALFSANTMTAGRAMIFFNNAMLKNPLGLILSTLTALATAFSLLEDAIDAVSEEVGREARDLQLLHLQVLTNNKGTDARVKLIDQLKQKYPELLKHINAETVNNRELAGAIQMVNQELINRAVLQKKDAELAEQAAKTADHSIEKAEVEQRLRNALADMAFEKRIPLPEGMTDIVELTNTYIKNLKRAGNTSASEVRHLVIMRNAYQYQLQEETKEMDKGNEMARERNRLLEKQNTYMAGLVEKTRMQGQGILKVSQAETEQRVGRINEEIAEIEERLSRPWMNATNDILGLQARKDNLVKQRDDLMTWSKDIVHQEQMTQEQVLKTVAYYNGLIEEKRKELDLQASPAGYKKVEQEIARLERLRDRITGGTKTKQQKTGEDLDKLLAEYKRFQAQLVIDTKDADEKALAELDQQHAEELKKVQEQQKKLLQAKKLTPTQASTDLDSLRSNQAQERADLIESQGQKRLDELKAYNDRLRTMLWDANSEFLDAEQTRVDNEMDLNREKQASLLDLEDQRRVVLLRIYEQNAKTALQAEIEKWDPVIEEAKKKLAEYDEALAASGEEPAAEDLKIRQDLVNGILDLEYAKNLAIESINKDRRVNEEEAERQHGLRMRQEYIRQLQHFATLANGYNDMLQGLIQYQDAGIAMAEQRADADGVRTEQELDQIERLKKARRDAALTAIAVQGAAAIANGVASAMAAPNWVVGVAQALSTVGIVLGLMAQARQIMNEANSDKQDLNEQRARAGLQDVPLGETGGVLDKKKGFKQATLTGVLDGPSHDDGGIAMIDNRTGRQVAELEGGEAYAVLSKRFVAKNQDLLPALFKASREGTRLSPFDRMPATPNPKRIAQAMQMRNGGPVTVRGTALVNMPTAPGSEDTDYVLTKKRTGLGAAGMDDMLALMQRMVDLQQRTASGVEQYPRTLTARVSQQELDRRKTELEYVKDLGRGRKTA